MTPEEPSPTETNEGARPSAAPRQEPRPEPAGEPASEPENEPGSDEDSSTNGHDGEAPTSNEAAAGRPAAAQHPAAETDPDAGDDELALDPTRERFIVFHQASLGVAAGLLAAALAAPLLFTFDTARTTWWILAGVGLVLAGLQAASLVYRRHLAAEETEGAPLERPEPEQLDFDEPWKEGIEP